VTAVRVLVTGVARTLGAQVARRLAARPGVETVVGVDVDDPAADLRPARFGRADLRGPDIRRLLEVLEPDVVVHTQLAGRGRVPPRLSHTIDVGGTAALLTAADEAGVRRVVLRSGTAAYGSGRDAPAVLHETDAPRVLDTRYRRDLRECEALAADFGVRHAGRSVAILRLASIVGPTADTPLVRYLTLPVIPTFAGHNPRLQVVHESDAADVVAEAALLDTEGTFNVAGAGAVTLHRALRRAWRPAVPIPGPVIAFSAGALAPAGRLHMPVELRDLLRFGRVVDTRRLRSAFGVTPVRSTEQALDDLFAMRGSERPAA
jgi:UDP-glucose 4-epimerase